MAMAARRTENFSIWSLTLDFFRLIYNDSVTKLNREIRMFPVSLLAAPFGFHARDYLEAVEEKADMPSMK